MADQSWSAVFHRYRFFLVGLACAVVTSLSVLNPDAALWDNDEGYFLGLGLSGRTLLDPRYGAFSILIFVYFQITKFPFAIALIHKLLMLSVFLLFFQKKLLLERGYTIFLALFLTFLYLNSYFLRDSLIFIVCLLAITRGASDRTIQGSGWLVPLALLRPQMLLLFLRPWISVLAVIAFVMFSRHLYAAGQMRDNGIFSIISAPFWEDLTRHTLSTVANLNPVPKYWAFLKQGAYLEYALLILATIPLFAVLTQMMLALALAPYRFKDYHRVLVGFAGVVVLYGSIGISADVRVFLAAICPFAIYLHKSLLKWQYLLLLVSALVIAAALRDVAKVALGV